MKHFNVFKSIVNCASCIVNRISASSIFSQNSLRIGQMTPPYPLRTLLVPVKYVANRALCIVNRASLLLLLAMVSSVNVWGEGSETFEKCSNSTSYGTVSWTGDNGLSWSASSFRTDQKITGSHGLTAKASTACTITMPLTSTQQSAGMGTFTFKYKYPYFDSGKSNNLSFTINGHNYSGTVSYNSSAQTVNITVNESLLPSSLTINIASGGRACFDDFSWTSCAPSYTVNWTINPAAGGTLSATSGTSTTVTPNSAYTYGSPAYTVTSGSGTAAVSQSTNTFTATPSANCTIQINMVEKPKYTVTLKDDNSTLTQASVGASVTLPSRTGCTGYTFAGWTKSWTKEQDEWTTTAPTIIPAGSYTPQGNENLYPVYTKTESGSGFSKYEKVTSAPSDWSGKYLLSTGTATATGYDNSNHFSSTSLSPGTTEYASYEFTLTKVGTVGYSIMEPSGKYVGWNSGTAFTTSNTAPTESSTNYLWTPNTEGLISNVYSSGRKIAYNGSSDFRPYSNVLSSGETYLYKRIEGGSTTSYISVPDCGPATYTLD